MNTEDLGEGGLDAEELVTTGRKMKAIIQIDNAMKLSAVVYNGVVISHYGMSIRIYLGFQIIKTAKMKTEVLLLCFKNLMMRRPTPAKID